MHAHTYLRMKTQMHTHIQMYKQMSTYTHARAHSQALILLAICTLYNVISG